MAHKGHWGEYTGNAKWSKDHAHTRVTKENYEATKRDDEDHMRYLKEDVEYDAHHGHSDEDMTADEKHISKLAGDLKYDEDHHGSPAHRVDPFKKKSKIKTISPGVVSISGDPRSGGTSVHSEKNPHTLTPGVYGFEQDFPYEEMSDMEESDMSQPDYEDINRKPGDNTVAKSFSGGIKELLQEGVQDSASGINYGTPLEKSISEIRKEPGMSNAGKYPNVTDFAGPHGSYPINNIDRARAALRLAHNAKNPAAIEAKVYAKYPSLKED